MAIEIIIEDGTGLTNSNSYAAVTDARAYAVNRGVALSAADDVVAAQLILAMDYLENFRDRYKGSRNTTLQALSWPRKGADLYDDVAYHNEIWFPCNAIPKALVAAQCQLVIEQFNGTGLLPTTTGQFTKSEKIGPITTEFSEILGTTQQPEMPAVKALMKNLLDYRGPLMNMRG